MKRPAVTERSAPEGEDTGLPLFGTWKALYLLVLACFALWITLLIVLTRSFS